MFIGLLCTFITALSWGILAIGLKMAHEQADPYTIVWMRFAVPFLLHILFFAFQNPKKLQILKHPPPLLILGGLFLGINFLGFLQGVVLTSPTNAQVFIQLAPFFLILIGVFYFKEKLQPSQKLGVVICLFGFILFFKEQFTVQSLNKTFLIGNLWILFAAIFWALFAALQKKTSETHSPHEGNLVVYGVATLLLSFFAQPQIAVNWSPSQWALMLYLSLNTLIAYGCLSEALKRIPSYMVSIIITLNPLITIFIMTFAVEYFEVTWIEPDSITTLGFLGFAFAILGVILTLIKRSEA